MYRKLTRILHNGMNHGAFPAWHWEVHGGISHHLVKMFDYDQGMITNYIQFTIRPQIRESFEALE